MDKLTYAGNLESLKSHADGEAYNFFHGDICHSDVVEKVLAEFHPSVIIHFAAEFHVDNSIDGPDGSIHSTILGNIHC